MAIEQQRVGIDEISLKEIVDVLKKNKWRIAGFGLLGLMFSVAYLLMAPKVYEAKWQMQMAQMATSNGTSNIEEPASLVQRLRFTTSYPVAVLQSCDVPEDGSTGEFLGGVLEIQAVKGLAATVDMRIRADSLESARQCAEGIVAMVVAQQRELTEERLAGRQEQLQQYQQAFREEQQQLEQSKKSELTNFGYLAKLDKLSWLRTRMDAIREEAMLSQKHPAKLTSPIFIPSKPISPKKRQVLMLGVLLGSMLGVMYALGNALLRKKA